MLDWLKSHVFIAAWSSAIIALIALIRKKSDPTNPLDWGAVVLYVGFLSALAAIITPGGNRPKRTHGHGDAVVHVARGDHCACRVSQVNDPCEEGHANT
jgi:hypothetical protein